MDATVNYHTVEEKALMALLQEAHPNVVFEDFYYLRGLRVRCATAVQAYHVAGEVRTLFPDVLCEHSRIGEGYHYVYFNIGKE